jgi:cytochrome c oxidase subunit 3
MSTVHPPERDESPIDIEYFHQKLPNWLQNFLPRGGGHHHREHEKSIFGFMIFLLSESMVFASFFVAYLALRLQTPHWLPPGVPPLELTQPAINTAVLLSSSFVIYFAERALKHRQIKKFRWLWLTTSAMGTFFLIGQAREWSSLPFNIKTGLFGTTFYLLTGFHGLHVFAGIILQLIMLFRSFMPGNYQKGHFGVTVTGLFWHFVDGIWIILFSLLYLWQP